LLERGDGVAIDVEEAFRLYDNAAESGMSNAQYALAYLLSRTPAEPEHLVRGHMWANLSATAGNKQARALRAEIERRMNAAQVAQAQNLARVWYDRNTSSEDHAARSYPAAASAVTIESPTR
jgi:TPR repeat protein